MLATANCANHYAEQVVYESDWCENSSSGISWLNVLTAESIPEEDAIDISHASARNNSESSYTSSSSAESCYVVLEIQRPRSMNELPDDIDDAEEDEEEDEEEEEEEEEDEEEEEIEEEIEELHFAQRITDNHNVCYDQFAFSMTNEIPVKEYIVERLQQLIDVNEYAKVTQPTIHELSTETLFNKAKTLSKFTKRVKAKSYMSRKEQCLLTSSDDEISHTTKLKTIRQINEYHSITNSTVTAEQQLSHHHPTNFSCQSTTSIDSIENKLSTPTPVRTTTTFSNLSSQRISNPTQVQRSGPKMGTTTLTRTFAFDRACMEKYGQVQKQKPESIQIPKIPVNDIKIKKDIGLPPKTMKPPPIPPSPKGSLSCRSFISNMQTSLYNGSEAATIDDYECQHHSSTVTTTFGSKSLTKPSNVLYLMKKCARTVTYEHYATNNLNENTPAEPKLLQVKYLDGRLPLKNIQTGELPRKTQTFSASISSRLNKIGLSKLSLTQDFSSTTSLNSSYRNRVFNRFRSLVDNNSSESSQSKPWQHKTITELFQDRKHKH